MKKILGLTIAAMLVMGLVGGGTWAYFSDPETLTGNYLSAGTLDLQKGASIVFNVNSRAPGDNATTAEGSAESVTLTAGGNLTGELDIAFGTILNAESGVSATQYENDGDNGTTGELGGLAQMAIWLDDGQDGIGSGTNYGLKWDGTVYNPTAVGQLQWETINSYDSVSWDAIVSSMSGT